jgi:hypothetical protein
MARPDRTYYVSLLLPSCLLLVLFNYFFCVLAPSRSSVARQPSLRICRVRVPDREYAPRPEARAIDATQTKLLPSFSHSFFTSGIWWTCAAPHLHPLFAHASRARPRKKKKSRSHPLFSVLCVICIMSQSLLILSLLYLDVYSPEQLSTTFKRPRCQAFQYLNSLPSLLTRRCLLRLHRGPRIRM